MLGGICMAKSGESKSSKVIKKDVDVVKTKAEKEIDAKAIKKETRTSKEKNVKEVKSESVINIKEKEVEKNPEVKKKASKSNTSDLAKQKTQEIEKKKQVKKEKDQNTSTIEKNNKEKEKESSTLSGLNDNNKTIKENKISKKTIFQRKEFQTIEVVTLVMLTCVISLTIGSLLGIKLRENNAVKGNIEVVGEEMQNFLKDYNYLIENYYGEVDKKALLNTAFKSMVDSLGDAYSGALDESVSNNFDIELKGDYEGLGIEIINDAEKNIFIYGIIPNSPASKADIKVGDKLITVNNTDVSGMTTTDFIKDVVKGSGNSEFVIVFEREGSQHTVTIKKDAITLQSVASKVYYENGKRIAYMKVSIFAENTFTQFKNELEKLESEGFESLIIDLRDNSGGHLTTVKSMISLFLDSSHVIYQTESKKERKKIYSEGKITKNYPIVIVGNANSASASEVMIGALTEEYGAILIGNQSFGKGTVQELHSLSNGDEYKFTTKKWLTPKGNWVHNNGIKPKIEVTLSKEYYDNPVEENDNQLRAAINYLAGVK